MNKQIPFEVEVEDTGSPARAGLLKLSRAAIRSPFFMPVGTYAAVKTQAPWDLRVAGAQVVLSNTYHLYLRPGFELIRDFGGLHKFMGWDGPILTDSGGFQIFSLAGLRKIEDEGVQFRSHIDGSMHKFTPELVIDIQRNLGSDFVMVLDECPPGDAPLAHWQTAVQRTTAWAQRSKARFNETGPLYEHEQYMLCIVQGGTDPALRRQSAEQLLALDSHAYAVGGLAVGEPKPAMFETLALMNELLPRDRPRYLMGVGTPSDLVRAVALGMDMFDCVMPTRNARNGQLFTAHGTMNIRNARFRNDRKPVDPECGCELCQHFSRAYLRHLLDTHEVLGLRLATGHNLWFYLHLMETMRQQIIAGTFTPWSRSFLSTYEGGSND